jgi:hypothetical protein
VGGAGLVVVGCLGGLRGLIIGWLVGVVRFADDGEEEGGGGVESEAGGVMGEFMGWVEMGWGIRGC